MSLSFGHVGYGDNHAYAIAKSASLLPDVHSIYFNDNNLSPRKSYKISNCVSQWIVNLDMSNKKLRSSGSDCGGAKMQQFGTRYEK